MDVYPNGLDLPIYKLAFLKNNHLAVSFRSKSQIKVVNLEARYPIKKLNGHSFAVMDLVHIRDNLLASCSWEGIKIWNYAAGRLLRNNTAHHDWVFQLTLLRNGNLASCSYQEIRIWESGNDDETLLKMVKMSDNYFMIVSLLQLHDDNLAVSSKNMDINIFSYNSGRLISTIYPHFNEIFDIILLEKPLLASASFDTTIKILNLETEKEVRTLRGHALGVYSLVLLRNNHLASSSEDSTVRVWNYTSGQLIKLIQQDSFSEILVLLGNGFLASGCEDGAIRVWFFDSNFNYFGNF
jgi:WD40 repeat protein